MELIRSSCIQKGELVSTLGIIDQYIRDIGDQLSSSIVLRRQTTMNNHEARLTYVYEAIARLRSLCYHCCYGFSG